jgi:hypothetical protein
MFAGMDVSIYGLDPQKRSSLTQAIKADGGQVHYVPSTKVTSFPFNLSLHRKDIIFFLFFHCFLMTFCGHYLFLDFDQIFHKKKQKQTTHLAVTEEFARANPTRVKEARKKGYVLIAPQYFLDCAAQGVQLDPTSYLISQAAQPEVPSQTCRVNVSCVRMCVVLCGASADRSWTLSAPAR